MKKLTTEEFIEKARCVHGDRYDYSEVSYTKAKCKIKIGCPLHGVFLQEPFWHSKGGGCPKCAGFIDNTSEFIQRSIEVHSNRYDYSEAVYSTCKRPTTIKCIVHGAFQQKPEYHLKGNGCPRCAGRGITMEEFLTRARLAHGARYDYSKVILEGTTKKVEMVCHQHGSFWQLPLFHFGKQRNGCPKCGVVSHTKKRTRSVNEFITEAQHIHGERYDYSSVIYIDSFIPVEIKCAQHGMFLQAPSSHLRGRGCKKCSHRVSKGETSWLDSIGVNRRQVRMILDEQLFEFDGYDEPTNTIFEYYGDYWHGNPIRYDHNTRNPQAKLTFRELYDRTIRRENLLRQFGFNLVTMWESEWTRWSKKKL